MFIGSTYPTGNCCPAISANAKANDNNKIITQYCFEYSLILSLGLYRITALYVRKDEIRIHI